MSTEERVPTHGRAEMIGSEALQAIGELLQAASVRLCTAQEGRVWLRSPCAVVANWECPPGSPGCPGC